MNRIIYSCEWHMEELLEVFLDENEEMPIMSEVAHTGIGCRECEKKAKYQLSGSEVKVAWE